MYSKGNDVNIWKAPIDFLLNQAKSKSFNEHDNFQYQGLKSISD